jgi:hypothetical protein
LANQLVEGLRHDRIFAAKIEAERYDQSYRQAILRVPPAAMPT